MEIEIKYKRHTLLMFYSPEDHELIQKYSWTLTDGLYAVTSIQIENKIKSIRCHRLIMNVSDPEIIVDHINGDQLDNRRENLRIATIVENGRNKGKLRRNCKFAYKGVGQDKNSYNATISVNGKSLTRGYFKTVEEAAKLYDAMAKHFYGEFARFNFPEIEPYDYLEWQHTVDSRNAAKGKIVAERKSIIDKILSTRNEISIPIIRDYLKSKGLELNCSNRFSYLQELNRMTKLGKLDLKKFEFAKNQFLNLYLKI